MWNIFGMSLLLCFDWVEASMCRATQYNAQPKIIIKKTLNSFIVFRRKSSKSNCKECIVIVGSLTVNCSRLCRRAQRSTHKQSLARVVEVQNVAFVIRNYFNDKERVHFLSRQMWSCLTNLVIALYKYKIYRQRKPDSLIPFEFEFTYFIFLLFI